ncbi:hypothetical protein GCM10020258_51700 [Sphingomonas yabuuchiae]
MRFVIDRQNVEFDQAGTGAPAILDKLTEYVADGIVEETRYLRDGGRIDLAVNDGGKGHGDAPDIERDCSPLRSPPFMFGRSRQSSLGSMKVRTRVVSAGSAGSSEPHSSVRS